MRILLDECIDERLRHEFRDYDCLTASYAGLAGLKNGILLNAAEAAGYEVLITVDQNIPYQQNLSKRTIAVLILKAPTNRLYDLRLTIPQALKLLAKIKPGSVQLVSGS